MNRWATTPTVALMAGFLTLGTASAVSLRAQPATKAPAKAPAKAPVAEKTGGTQAPRFEVELLWPKPMPNHWLMGSATGVAVDARDHVFVVHRIDSFTARTETGGGATPPIGECCISAPPVLEFDPAGNLVNSWGGPGQGYDWPLQPTGIAVAANGNVWIAGAGGLDAHILEFTHEGKFVRQIGKPGTVTAPAAPAPGDTNYAGVSAAARGGAAPGTFATPAGRGGRGGRGGAPAPVLPPNSNSMELFGGAAKIAIDGNEAFVADGYRNRRVAVVDLASGTIKRFWGASGNKPDDALKTTYSPDGPSSPQFSTVRCAEPSKDGLVYVCDRANDRLQVFKKDGSFVREVRVAPRTLGEGSVWDVAFSRDAQQKYLYVADGMNMKVRVFDRLSLVELASFGDGGRQPGQFYAVHGLATDSKGNLYTVENYEGKRVQRFVFKGVGAVTNKAVLWPGAKP